MFVTKASLVDPERLQDAAGAGAQPLDATLTALAALDSSPGAIVQTGADTFTKTLLSAGSWTPTLTAVANVASATPNLSYYIRVGNNVFCFLGLAVDPTLTATTTQLGISLPVASNFAAQEQCAGTMNSNGVEAGRVRADSTNDRAELVYTSAGTAATTFFGTFGYTIV